MTDQVQETAAEETTTTAAAKPEKAVPRIIAMEDGTTANFGARANLLSDADSETGVLTFKISNGKIITFNAFSEIEGQDVGALTTFQKTVYLSGLLEKVKSALAPVKLDDLATAIDKQLSNLKQGKFNVRGSETTPTLDSWQEAFAVVKSRQAAEKGVEGFEHWSDVTNAKTVAEVLTAWGALSTSEKNAVRKNVQVVLERAQREVAKGNAEALV